MSTASQLSICHHLSTGYIHPPTITDSLFDAAARGVRFKVNRTELQNDDPFIKLFDKELVPLLRSMNMRLEQIYVRGAASPEGPYDNNRRLGQQRTKRLIDFINQRLGQRINANSYHFKAITEDYGYLVELMRQANDADYKRVNDIFVSTKGNERLCKTRLMKLDDGKLWQRLLQVYFPTLRQSRVILWFVCQKEPEAPKPLTLSDYTLPPIRVEAQPVTGAPVALKEVPIYKHRHLIAARTNLLHDFLYVPQFGKAFGGNIQLEYYPLNGHLTYNAGFTFINHRHWKNHKFFQIRDVQLELRRYFVGGGRFIGPYMSVYAEGTSYGIGFSETKGWEGEGGGAGLSAGYTCRLNRKGSLRLELSLSVGAFLTRYDPYVWGNPITSEIDGKYYYDYHGNTSGFKKRNHRFTWFGPTNAGIHITYDIVYRKKQYVGYTLKYKNRNEKGGAR